MKAGHLPSQEVQTSRKRLHFPNYCPPAKPSNVAHITIHRYPLLVFPYFIWFSSRNTGCLLPSCIFCRVLNYIHDFPSNLNGPFQLYLFLELISSHTRDPFRLTLFPEMGLKLRDCGQDPEYELASRSRRVITRASPRRSRLVPTDISCASPSFPSTFSSAHGFESIVPMNRDRQGPCDTATAVVFLCTSNPTCIVVLFILVCLHSSHCNQTWERF